MKKRRETKHCERVKRVVQGRTAEDPQGFLRKSRWQKKKTPRIKAIDSCGHRDVTRRRSYEADQVRITSSLGDPIIEDLEWPTA